MVREFGYRVVSTEEVGEGLVRSVVFVGELAGLLAPGQFVNLQVPGDPSEIVRIPLSFAGVDAAAGTVELVYAVVGSGTRRLAGLAVGEGGTVLGPCGRGWRVPSGAGAAAGTAAGAAAGGAAGGGDAAAGTAGGAADDGAAGAAGGGAASDGDAAGGAAGAGAAAGAAGGGAADAEAAAGTSAGAADAGRVLLVAGGIGVTPIVAAGRALAEAGVGFDAVVAAQTAARVWGVSELEAHGARVVVCTDDGSRGVAGFATVAVPQLLAERSYDAIWTCGPQPMMAGVARIAREAHLACQVSLERMMTCGFGACHTCNVALAAGGYAFCCTDGPVFDAEEVAW